MSSQKFLGSAQSFSIFELMGDDHLIQFLCINLIGCYLFNMIIVTTINVVTYVNEVSVCFATSANKDTKDYSWLLTIDTIVKPESSSKIPLYFIYL